jgi:hypothetical protein
MGRLIDEIEIYKRLRPKVDNGTLDEIMLDIPTVEAIPKDQYKARLKADLKAILVELELRIDEIPINPKASEAFKLGQATAYDRCEFLIHQKINVLKADQEGKNEISVLKRIK